ncbi:MAG: hypothetical protein ACK4TO_02905 [Candidatus Nitrosotenuis sp.]
MLPDRCSVKQKGKQCVNPPEFVISVKADSGEYMVGVTCEAHKNTLSEKLLSLQKQRKILNGKIKFEKLKAVGTDCVKASPDDLLQL